MYCESSEIAPGEVAHLICLVPRRRRLSGVFMDAPTAATFTVERIELLKPGEMQVLAGVLAPGALVAVRNGGARPARFRAELECAPDLDVLERELGVVVDRDWRAAHDRAKAHA